MTEPAATPDSPDVEVTPIPAAGSEVVQFRGRNAVMAKLTYAKALSDSGLLPAAYRGKPANVLFAVEFGEMLGLAPMAAIHGVHIIEGKPSASAALISALVRRAGHRLRVSGDDKSATASITRADDPDFEFKSTWTIERARQAGLANKDVWKKYPAAMLKARAVTEAARDACEEALSGMHYTPEELGAEVDEEGAPTTTVEQVDWDAEIRKCGNSRERFAELWKSAPNDQIKAKIQAAADKAGLPPKTKPEKTPEKPAEAETETVDAEIVEDEPSKTESPSRVAAGFVDNLIGTADTGSVAGMIRAIKANPKVAAINVSGIVPVDAAAELDISKGEKVPLADLASLVLAYLEANQYSVVNGAEIAAQQMADAS